MRISPEKSASISKYINRWCTDNIGVQEKKEKNKAETANTDIDLKNKVSNPSRIV